MLITLIFTEIVQIRSDEALYRGRNAGTWLWIGVKTRNQGDQARVSTRMQDLLTLLALCWTRIRCD